MQKAAEKRQNERKEQLTAALEAIEARERASDSNIVNVSATSLDTNPEDVEAAKERVDDMISAGSYSLLNSVTKAGSKTRVSGPIRVGQTSLMFEEPEFPDHETRSDLLTTGTEEIGQNAADSGDGVLDVQSVLSSLPEPEEWRDEKQVTLVEKAFAANDTEVEFQRAKEEAEDKPKVKSTEKSGWGNWTGLVSDLLCYSRPSS